MDWFLKLSNDNAELRAELARKDAWIEGAKGILDWVARIGPIAIEGEIIMAQKAQALLTEMEAEDEVVASNETEQNPFYDGWCKKCIRENYPDDPFCSILTASLRYYPDDPRYPAEWIIAEDGRSCCLAFESGEGEAA